MTDTTDCVLRIALPVGRGRLFDYKLPEGVQNPEAEVPGQQLPPGIRVRVPFRNRELTGVLVSSGPRSGSAARLRRAQALLDTSPLLPPSLLQLALWTADYYHYSPGLTLLQSLPSSLRAGRDLPSGTCKKWRVVCNAAAEEELLDSRAWGQKAAWQQLCGCPDGIADKALKQAGIERALLHKLVERGLVESFEITEPVRLFDDCQSLLKEQPLPLTSQQQQALDAILSRNGAFSVTLLQGVTGSGKTEVYLQAIACTLACRKQVLVLVPEIGLTPQMLERFHARFHTPVAVLHSGLSDRQRLHNWLAAKRGEVGIVLATRSGIFTPLLRPGLIIVDEEHDLSYKQQDRGASFSARDLALVRARLESVAVVLGSATPCLETLHNAQIQRFYRQLLTHRPGPARPPELVLVDSRRQVLTGGLTAASLEAINSCLSRGEQVLVFLNRRGYAPTLMCDDCNNLLDCPCCDAHLTLHMAPPALRCHHCDSCQPVPDQCPSCHSRLLSPVGQGTERTEEVLAEHFHPVDVLRIDSDSVKKKGAFATILERVQTGKQAILVGTRMLAKGHHFPAVTLVVIVNADAGFFSTDFRGPERTGQTILQVAGRAGRGDRRGKVLIQTACPDNALLQTLVTKGYGAFAEALLAQRMALSLPPFGHLALITAEAQTLDALTAFWDKSAALARQLSSRADPAPVVVTGPLPAPMERRQGRLRWQLHLRSCSRPALHHLLRRLVAGMAQQSPVSGLRWAVDVDPQEMG